ncbi:hypothetical protein BD770DRAFT_414233 [Pilaira anomala]|nr:hypothetical protein BD770DRAFT_414233 [Pilaira anomala]
MDLMQKSGWMQNPDFIGLITTSVLNEDGHHFAFSTAQLFDDGSWFIVYLPRPETTSSDAIILEIQKNVTEISFTRSIKKCLQVYNELKVQASIVILCIGTISFTVSSLLSPSLKNPCWQILDKTVWANKCLFISKDEIDLDDSKNNQHLDPLTVLAMYFSDNKIQKQKLQDIGNPTIKLLDSINKKQ